jgi:hypothetical protein
MGFGSSYVDATGDDYLINRYYDSVAGQFESIDPELNSTQMPFEYHKTILFRMTIQTGWSVPQVELVLPTMQGQEYWNGSRRRSCGGPKAMALFCPIRNPACSQECVGASGRRRWIAATVRFVVLVAPMSQVDDRRASDPRSSSMQRQHESRNSTTRA